MKKATIDAGSLRHRVSLEQQIETPDGCGGYTTTWQLVTDLWAAIKPLSAAAHVSLGTVNTKTTHQFTIRWRSDCKPEMRVTKAGREFLITALIDPDETKRYLILNCEEVQ